MKSVFAFTSTFLLALVSAQPICPTYIRAVHSYMPSAAGVPDVDYYVNGAKVQTMEFRQVSSYISVPAGRINIAIRAAGASRNSEPLADADFTVAVGKFYTAGFLGSVAAPAGTRVYNSPPIIVNEDVRIVPNVNRFNGLWYRWSETNLEIDFRTVYGDPEPAENVTAAPDASRISDLQPKTVIPIPELPSGTPYSFYPVLLNANAPLPNPRLTQTGGLVAVRNLIPRSGAVYDFFATGDTLLNAHPYNLQVGYTETPVKFDAQSGCTLAGAAVGSGRVQASSTDTTDRIDRVTIASLTIICLIAVLMIVTLINVIKRPHSAGEAASTAAANVKVAV